jgi:sporulation protein YlmC with PRC-barrel domain
VASEERLRELEDKYEGYSVYDNRGEKIGKVDDLFIDEEDHEEYIGVKMGFLGRTSTLIPMDIVRVNEADKAVEVSESKDHIKDAPSFDDDEDITPEYEDRIRNHFGLESPTETSRSQGSSTTSSRESSTVDTERVGSSAGTTGGSTSSSTGEQGSSMTPSGTQAEEAETSEEGGRPKVRRRIIREEIIEEDPNS